MVNVIYKLKCLKAYLNNFPNQKEVDLQVEDWTPADSEVLDHYLRSDSGKKLQAIMHYNKRQIFANVGTKQHQDHSLVAGIVHGYDKSTSDLEFFRNKDNFVKVAKTDEGDESLEKALNKKFSARFGL